MHLKKTYFPRIFWFSLVHTSKLEKLFIGKIKIVKDILICTSGISYIHLISVVFSVHYAKYRLH